jgi:uncharacterized protein (TIGR03790 family)
MLFSRATTLCLLLLVTARCFAAGQGAHVLIVYDSASRDSEKIARYYAQKREVPKSNLCPTKPQDDVALTWEQFDSQVRGPVRKCLAKLGAKQNEVLYLVLAYKMPYKLKNIGQEAGTGLDSFLIDPDDKVIAPCAGICPAHPPAPNPYYGEPRPMTNQYSPALSLEDFRSSHEGLRLYSVWHLDAATPELAMKLVDSALAAEAAHLEKKLVKRPVLVMENEKFAEPGKDALHACIDRRYEHLERERSGMAQGDWMLLRAANLARAAGLRVTEDTHPQEFGTAPAALRCEDAFFYSGWYALDHYNDAFTWAPGAIGVHLDSLSANHLRRGANWSENAVQRGITITAGAVSEPYLTYLPHPDGLLRDLFLGLNAGDAMLRNTPWLRWQIVNIGDPLYRPFPK